MFSAKAAAHRLRRTRQRLGSYRHDLVIAMRIINKIEHEIVQAEWESWVSIEVTRCKATVSIMGKAQAEPSTDWNESDGEQHDRFQEMRLRLEDYCQSCSGEQDRLFGRPSGANTTS